MKRLLLSIVVAILCLNNGFCQTDWEEINAPPGTSHNRVQFTDYQTGYVIANETNLYKTTDGAQTWSLLNVPIGSGGKIQAFHIFGDNTTIIALGPNYTQQYGRIFKSTDAGETWEIVWDLPVRYFKGVHFLNDSVGWAWADKMFDSYLYKTEDAGETWNEIFVTNKWIRSLCFLTKNIGWRCSRAGGHIAKTTDGGITWTDQLNLTGIDEGMNDIIFLDEQLGFAAGDERTLLKTTDGGENWQYLSSEENPGILPDEVATDWAIKDIYFVNDQVGWIVGGPC